MAQQLRFCLILEQTNAMRPHWADIRGHIVEPVLRSLAAGPGGYELALVLFGAAGGLSPAVVQCSHWTQDASQLRQWLDDAEFWAGGSQPVALGQALLAAAALLELPSALAPAPAPGAPPMQAHCLVCMVTDPSTAAVPWPYPPVTGKWSHLPHLATPAELIHALCARRVTLSLATRLKAQHFSTAFVQHWLHTVVPPQAPLGPPEQFAKDHEKEWRALGTRTAKTPGGSVAVFPHWDQGLQAVLQYNASRGVPQAQASRALGASPGGIDGDTPSPPPHIIHMDLTADTPGAGAGPARGLTPQPGAGPTSPPGPPMPPAPQYVAAPDRLAEGSGQVGTPSNAPVPAPVPSAISPNAGFMDLMAMPSSVVAAVGQAQPPVAAAAPQQYLPAAPAAQQPGQPAGMAQALQPGQQSLAGGRPVAVAPPQPAAPGLPQMYPGGLALAWRGPLLLGEKVRGSMPPLLGSGELIARADQLQTLWQGALPQQLVIVKFVNLRAVHQELARSNPVQMHLVIKEWAAEGEAALIKMASRSAAAMVEMPQGYSAVLLPILKPEGGEGGPPKLSLRLAVQRPMAAALGVR